MAARLKKQKMPTVTVEVPYTVSYCINCSKVYSDNRDNCYNCHGKATTHHTEVRVHTNVAECVAKLAVKWNNARIISNEKNRNNSRSRR